MLRAVRGTGQTLACRWAPCTCGSGCYLAAATCGSGCGGGTSGEVIGRWDDGLGIMRYARDANGGGRALVSHVLPRVSTLGVCGAVRYTRGGETASGGCGMAHACGIGLARGVVCVGSKLWTRVTRREHKGRCHRARRAGALGPRP